MEADLKQYAKWYENNLLVLNAAKTDIMTITASKTKFTHFPNIQFQNLKLKQSGYIKYLGFFLDQHLLFKKNLAAIKKKILQIIKCFMQNRKNVTSNTAAIWYKSIIRPILEYCAPTTFTSSLTIQNKLLAIENRCLKIINLQEKCITRQEHGIPPLLNRLKYLHLLAFFKLTHGLVPSIDNAILPTRAEPTTRLGAAGGFLLGVSSGSRTTLNFGVAVFNSLPPQIRSSQFLKEFKKELRNHLLRV
jgi:hypothetical protein